MPAWTFVRHGESEANAQGWLAGSRDTPLTEVGIRQAQQLRIQLARKRFDRVLVSDLERARHTAQIALAGRALPLVESAALRERAGGEFEGLPLDELRESGKIEALRYWDRSPPGGETVQQVAARAIQFLAQHDAEEDVLVVAHGALIRSVFHALDRGPFGELSTWRPRNCEVSVRRLEPGTWERVLHQVAGTFSRA